MTAVEKLESMGYYFSLDEGGNIRAELRGGLTPPPDASKLLAWCKAHREEVKDALIFRSGTVRSNVRTCFFSCDDAAMLDKWKSLQARQMVGIVKVYAHQRSGRVDVHYEPLVDPWVIDAELYGHESL